MSISRFLMWSLKLLILTMVIGAGFLCYELYNRWNQLPNEEAIRSYYSLTREGGSASSFVPLDELPKHTYLAVLAAQNSDYLAEGSAWGNCVWSTTKRIFNRPFSEECSNELPMVAAERMLQRHNAAFAPHKLDRLLLGWKMDAVLKREEVFELVLNKNYYGQGAYGIAQAANVYFGKKAGRLTIADSALLAGITKAPNRHDTIRHPSRTKIRRDFVLSQMKRRGMISNTEWKTAVAAALSGGN